MPNTVGFTFTIKSFITDIDGVIIDPALRPVGMPLDYPVPMFAYYDRSQGYKNLLEANPPLPGSFFISSYIYGFGSENFLQFNPLADIVTKMKLGDLVLVYGNSKNSPSHFCFVIISGEHLQPGAVDLIPDPLFVDGIIMTSPNPSQFYKHFEFMDFDRYGAVGMNQVSPISYLPESQKLGNVVFMAVKLKLDPYFGFVFTLLGGYEYLTLELMVIRKNK